MLHSKTLSHKIIIIKVKVKAVYSEELSKATLSHETLHNDGNILFNSIPYASH